MSELANFLPTIGAPPSTGGGGSFNTISVNTSVAAAVGEAIFVDHTGTFFTESQLKSYNHEISLNANNYPPRVATSLIQRSFSGGGNGLLPLDPDAYYSYVPNGATPNTVNNLNMDSFGGFYSTRLGSGFWMVIGLGGSSQSRSNTTWSDTMAVSILSSDGSTHLKSTGFSLSSFGLSGMTEPNTTDIKILGIYPFADSAKVIFRARDNSIGGNLVHSIVTLTRNTSTNVVTLTSTTTGTNALRWNADYTLIPAMCVNPIFEYNSVPYFIGLTGSNEIRLLNLNTNANTTITIPDGVRWDQGEIVQAVKAGTSIHLYATSAGHTATVLDLVSMSCPPLANIAAEFSVGRSASGLIVKLDDTTYAFQVNNTNWRTFRHSADGYSSLVTTNYTTSSLNNIVNTVTVSGTTYVITGSLSYAYYSNGVALGHTVAGKLSYDSVAGTSSILPLTSTDDTLPGLLNRLPYRTSGKNIAINALNIKYILSFSIESARNTSTTGKLFYHVFSPRHYTFYVPTYIGQATTAGTAPTVLLHDTVRSFEGAVQGTTYSGEVMGLPSEYAVRLLPRIRFSRPSMLTRSGSNSGTNLSEDTKVLNNSNYVESFLGEAILAGAISYLITSDYYRPRRRLVGEATAGVNPAGCMVACVYICNGRLVIQHAYTSTSSGSSNSQVKLLASWESADWPVLVGLTYASGGTNDSAGVNIISGTYREYEV